jgi:hypothetical protein
MKLDLRDLCSLIGKKWHFRNERFAGVKNGPTFNFREISGLPDGLFSNRKSKFG